MTLRRKMASGAFWSVVEKGGQQGISFIVFMVLARLVGPEEYGLANICFIYFVLSGIVVFGLVEGIVSLQIEDDECLSSIFWVIVGLGLLLSLFCIITALPLANVLNQPKLAPILYCFSVVPFLLSLSSVPNMLVMKAMNFKVYAIRTFVATILGGGVGLVLAFNNYGAYSIVWQQVVVYAVMNLIIWPYAGWRPRLVFNARSVSLAIKPGLNMLGVTSLSFFDQQFPRLVISHLLGASSLGFYAFVMRIRLALQEILITAPLVVLYPSMSQIKDNKQEQSDIAGRVILLGCTFLFPILSIASATAPIYVPILFGESWEPAILLLQIYILGAACLPFVSVVREIFRANNRLDYFLRMNVLTTILGLCTLFLLPFNNGLVLMALGTTVVWFGILPVYLILVNRCLGISLWKEVAQIWPFVIASCLSFLVIYLFRAGGFYSVNAWFTLFISLALGCVTFVLFAFVFGYRKSIEIISIVKMAFNRGK